MSNVSVLYFFRVAPLRAIQRSDSILFLSLLPNSSIRFSSSFFHTEDSRRLSRIVSSRTSLLMPVVQSLERTLHRKKAPIIAIVISLKSIGLHAVMTNFVIMVRRKTRKT